MVPGSMVVPSWRLSSASKPTFRPGGLDLVTVTREPPVFFTVKASSFFCPTCTVPKSRLAGSRARLPASAAVPESCTVPGPAEVSSASASVKLPTPVGAKFTVAVTDWPGMSVAPAAGAPLTEKGAAGMVSPLMTRLAPPTLVMVTVPLSTWLTRAPPKLMTGGARARTGPGVCPMPLRVVETGLPSAWATMAPERIPARLGVKVTGTVSVWPVPSAAGRAGVGVPRTKSPFVELRSVTVTLRRAVKTT